MLCFRCQKEDAKQDKQQQKYIPVNVGRDNCNVGDIHLYICQTCCAELVKFLKGASVATKAR
jgi:hypothetical protein